MIRFPLHRERGATLMEFLFSLPLLVLVFVGTVVGGQALISTMPLLQTSYELALVAGDFLPEDGLTRVNERALAIQQRANSSIHRINPASFRISTTYDEASGAVDLISSGSPVRAVFESLGFSVNAHIHAPLLSRRLSGELSGGFDDDPNCSQGFSDDLNCTGSRNGDRGDLYGDDGDDGSDGDDGDDELPDDNNDGNEDPDSGPPGGSLQPPEKLQGYLDNGDYESLNTALNDYLTEASNSINNGDSITASELLNTVSQFLSDKTSPELTAQYGELVNSVAEIDKGAGSQIVVDPEKLQELASGEYYSELNALLYEYIVGALELYEKGDGKGATEIHALIKDYVKEEYTLEAQTYELFSKLTENIGQSGKGEVTDGFDSVEEPIYKNPFPDESIELGSDPEEPESPGDMFLPEQDLVYALSEAVY